MERKIQRLFSKGCAEYGLLEDGDKVLVALSGGKDSLELVRLMARQSRIHKPRIEVEAVHVLMDNIPYETDRSYLEGFCNDLGMRLTILHTSFDEERNNALSNPKPHCFLCSWQRRKAIFRYAEENGFTKIALGHHQDDILITALMNMTFEGYFGGIAPSMKMKHYNFSVIRPLCLVPEHLIKEIAESLGFEKLKTLCPYETKTRRADMADLFHKLEEMNPEARYSMWRALQRS